jgi:hypothetical protein
MLLCRYDVSEDNLESVEHRIKYKGPEKVVQVIKNVKHSDNGP